MRSLLFLLPALLCAHLAAAESRSQEDLATQIEAKFANKVERVVAHAVLKNCNLTVEHSYVKNCAAENTPAQQVSKVGKSVHSVDLTTVRSVKVSSVRGDTHVGLWPARNNLLSKVLGRRATVRQIQTLYHCNGDAYEQDKHLSFGAIISKPVDPKLEQLLTDYIDVYCK